MFLGRGGAGPYLWDDYYNSMVEEIFRGCTWRTSFTVWEIHVVVTLQFLLRVVCWYSLLQVRTDVKVTYCRYFPTPKLERFASKSGPTDIEILEREERGKARACKTFSHLLHRLFKVLYVKHIWMTFTNNNIKTTTKSIKKLDKMK